MGVRWTGSGHFGRCAGVRREWRATDPERTAERVPRFLQLAAKVSKVAFASTPDVSLSEDMRQDTRQSRSRPASSCAPPTSCTTSLARCRNNHHGDDAYASTWVNHSDATLSETLRITRCGIKASYEAGRPTFSTRKVSHQATLTCITYVSTRHHLECRPYVHRQIDRPLLPSGLATL